MTQFDHEIIENGVIFIGGQNIKLFKDNDIFINVLVNEEISNALWAGKSLHVWLQNGQIRRYADENMYVTYGSIKTIDAKFFTNLKGKTVLLYVSSSDIKEEYLQLPYDYVILNNKEYFGNTDVLIVDNKIILMPFENNMALRLLKDYGVKIQCFVGIVDGCCEGGNDSECVNSNSFFGRLSPILDEKVYYITDHFYKDQKGLIERYGFLNVHFEAIHTFDSSLLFDEAVFNSGYFNANGEDHFYPVQRTDALTVEKTIGNINVAVSHASIWDYENEFDCIVYSKLRGDQMNYLPYENRMRRWYVSLNNKNEEVIYPNPAALLLDANKYRWERIGSVPIFHGQYDQLIDAIQNFSGDYPKKIHFFHIEGRDMIELRTNLRNFGILSVSQAKEIYCTFCDLLPEYLNFSGFAIPHEIRRKIALSIIENHNVIVPFKIDFTSAIEELTNPSGANIIRSFNVLSEAGYKKISKSEIMFFLKHHIH